MKNLKLLLLTVITIFTLNTKAQNDPNVGFYVDGIKVDSINCYEFQDLKVVFLWNSEWSQYDYIKIQIQRGHPNAFKNGLTDKFEKAIPVSSIDNYLKGKYIVYTIYGKDKAPIDLCQKPYYDDELPTSQVSNLLPDNANSLTKGNLKYDYALGKGKPSDDNILKAILIGLTFKNVKEEFNNTCNCITKTKKYSFIHLDKGFSLLLSGRFNGGRKDMSVETDLTKPCTYLGTKVDFSNLGKSGSSSNTSSNSNTNSNITNNAAVKAETPAKTTAAIGKTIITTVAPTSAVAVKPLDKTKPGYFEEKSEDKKFMYRNGYQKGEGVYHGEVREYENNQLEKIIVFTDGVEDGLYVTFSDGKVEWQGTYKNGKKDGVWKHFNNGQLQESEKYIHGEKQD